MNRLVSVLLACTSLLMATRAYAETPVQVFLDLDAGAAFASYNDVKASGRAGTRFSLTDELTANPGAFFRGRLGLTIAKHHNLYFLYAPLRIESSGRLDRDIQFDDQRYREGANLRASYRFDSYRLTYRYDFLPVEGLAVGLGVTAKIRDAAISVEGDGANFTEKTNTGVVPLLTFRLDWEFVKNWGLLLDADGLVGPQGRAEDALLAFTYRFNEHVRGKLGYRIVEGGADNDEVYNFAAVHFADAGLIVTF